MFTSRVQCNQTFRLLSISTFKVPRFRGYAKLIAKRSDKTPEEQLIPKSRNTDEQIDIEPPQWVGLVDTIKSKKLVKQYPQRPLNESVRGRVYTNTLTPGLEQTLQNVSGFNEFFQTEDEIQTLIQAVTHKSYGTGKVETNERLTFLGKYVLDMFVGQLLTDKYIPPQPENPAKETDLTNVSSITLSIMRALYTNKAYLAIEIASKSWKWADQRAHFDKADETLRIFGYDAFTTRSRIETIGEAVMAVVGAVYWCRGPSWAKRFIEDFIVTDIPKNVFAQLIKCKLHEQVLSEVLQAHLFKAPKKIEERISVDNYKCSFFIGMEMIGFATADNAEAARNLAALNGLTQLSRRISNY
jgi:dsRNA-specific ribonuclease